MATTVEFVVSRSTSVDNTGESPTHERVYKIFGTQDDTVAHDALVAAAPANVTVQGYLLAKATFEVKEEDYGVWNGTVSYEKYTKSNAGESTFSFDITTENQHITNSWSNVGRYGSAPDLGGLIGWDGEQATGTDIMVPSYGFSEQHTITNAALTPAYKAAIFAVTGKVNSGTFKGFQAGEVLFLGASGTIRSSETLWDVTFRFVASQNMSNLSVGGIGGITKRGWDHLWILYQHAAGADGLYKTPRGVYVEQVYQFANFATLGIGT